MADTGFAMPEENVFDLHGPTDPQRSQTAVTDWYTANPEFEHVTLTTIDTSRSGR